MLQFFDEMASKLAPQSIQSINELINLLLKNRGITKKSEVEAFFNPKLSDYEKEFNFSGIEVAKKRILKSIKEKELIIVYGDYDVDGVCATAVMYLGLTSLGAKALPYIPHREKEGYGLSKFGLDAIKAQGASLVITVDNGIVAYDQAKYAKELGLDLIITDHHLPGEEIVDCVAIVHSTKFCGTGVAWCLIRELVGEEKATELLDLVAVGTVCDLMPLLGVNRAFVREGLKKLDKTKRVGWLALFDECKIDATKLTAFQVGYIIGPRLNAVGRLEHAIDSLRLLCTKDFKKAKELARVICKVNDQKKNLINDAIFEARNLIKQNNLSQKKILVLHSENWIPGIVGLVASRISEEFQLPAIVISKGEVESKGSARTINGLNIVETIRKCKDLLIDVGGHPQAAGFTILTRHIETFSQKLNEVLVNLTLEKTPKISVEAFVETNKIGKIWVRELEKFEPFGVGNPKPILGSSGIEISDIRTVGNGQHLKFKVDEVDAIAFSMGNLATELKNGQTVNLAYYLDINSYNGADKLQFRVVDIESIV